MADKPTFAPLPARAIGDLRLTGLHLRVLAAVALHDRLSNSRGKGQGCWAGNRKLADTCGCNYTNLSTALTDLGQYGYLAREAHPLNKRLRIFRVHYTPDDQTAAKNAENNVGDSLPIGKAQFAQTGAIVCPPKTKATADQEVKPVEYIRLKPLIHFAKSDPINSVETAPPENVGGVLAQLERRVTAQGLTPQECSEWQPWLEQIAFDSDQPDSNRHVAERLLSSMRTP